MPGGIRTDVPEGGSLVSGLVFNKQKHIYGLDGKVVPSVSEIIKPLHHMAYGEVTEEGKQYMADAARRGSKVHAATEQYDKEGSCEIEEDLAGYMTGYLRFLETYPTQWTDIERMGVEKNGLFAGTIDRVGFINGEPYIVDIKTTSDISAKKRTVYATQLTAYSRILGWTVDDCCLAILQLKKDGTFNVIDVPHEDELLDACVYMYYKLNTRRKKFEI